MTGSSTTPRKPGISSSHFDRNQNYLITVLSEELNKSASRLVDNLNPSIESAINAGFKEFLSTYQNVNDRCLFIIANFPDKFWKIDFSSIIKRFFSFRFIEKKEKIENLYGAFSLPKILQESEVKKILSQVVNKYNIDRELQKETIQALWLLAIYITDELYKTPEIRNNLSAFNYENSTGSFIEIDWPRFISTPEPELLFKLYIPGLSLAIYYDRLCAYFSSRVLSTAARGFGGLIQNLLTYSDEINKPAVRLLVNEQLDRKDIEYLLASGDQSKLIETLLKRFRTPKEALEKNRLQMLAWLVASGWLEVKVGLMARTGGIAHAKYGILTDREGNRIAFMGSDNETDAALVENYEELEVRPDWEDKEFVDYYQSRFETIWRGEDPHVEVLPLPDAVRQKLICLAPKNPPEEMLHDPATQEAAILWHFIAAAPYLPQGEYACDTTAMVDPWPHQRRVVEDTAKGYPAGRLLCDEVGMGKTIEAILVLRRLMAGRGVKRALLLVPAGLLRQWQDELREKGGLIVPRWEDNYLAWPDGQRQKADASRVFTNQDILLISREWARLPGNREALLNAPVWDLVLMDEAHAARRSTQKEREFNSANLLLELLRELQLRQRAKSIMLLSATPMQTQPWEPWDLLTTLGVGDEWMVEFEDIRQYYHGIQLLRAGDIGLQEATDLSRLVVQDDEFPYPPQNGSIRATEDLAEKLTFAFDARDQWAEWLRKGAPLGRRMHRNTRGTLRHYYQLGLLDSPPPKRRVLDEVFEYSDVHERQVYDEVKAYINERYEQLEKEKTGKGFVMTIYHRRASSSPLALRRSLNRRKDKLERIIKRQSYDPLLALEEEQVDLRDLIDADLEEKVDPGLPTSPQAAETEKHSIEKLLTMLDQLGAADSKLDKFFNVLERATKDGRPVLVFTEYTDTMEYLREQLKPTYGTTLGCYSGRGGEILQGHQWIEVPKSEITDRLSAGALKVLICTDAASEGLNLQAASALINYDLPWNPSKVEQRIGRIDRIGQRQAIIPVFNLFLDDSVDMRVYEVLQERCGLFEQFVGKMQPVLALARSGLKKILTPQEEMKLIQEMQITANEVEKDETIGAEFAEAEAIKIPEVVSPLTLQDLETGILSLKKANGKIKVRSTGEKQWSLRGLDRKAIKVSTDLESLERDKYLTPLTAGAEIVDRIRDTLPLPSRSPLVIAERMNESYRCVEARWIQGEQILPVNNFAQLREFIKVWDGKPVSPKLIHQAYEEAERTAFERMMQMDFDSGLTVREGLEKQIEAARLRLRREVGRTLRCFGSDNLNNYFRKQVQAENNPEGRYHQALRRLGGYPEWTVEELQGFGQYVSELSEEQQNGRIRLGSEIDAALNDPRWKAEEQLRKKAKLNVILEKDFEEFTPKEQEQFISDLARAVKISSNKIRILRILPGSTMITLEYESDEEASRFVSMYINGDPAIRMFGSLRIAGIVPSQMSPTIAIDGKVDLAGSQNLMRQREIHSLRRQIDEHQRRILEIQEKMASFTDPRNISPDLEQALNWHQEQLNVKTAKLNALVQGNS